MRLRSNFEPGTTRWAVRRAQWLALGLSEADLEKPKIAIVNSSSKLSICFSHLDEVAKSASDAVRAAGGVPFEIRTAAPSDFVTSAGLQGRYLMPTRDLIVNDIEAQVEGAVLDGMVLLSSCDKTTPAHLMAAGRLDIPAIIVPCGYQLGSACGSEAVDIEDVYKSIGKLRAGQIGVEEVRAMTCIAIRGPGVCAGLGTANSMHILAEALGMALAGSTPLRAGSARNHDVAARSGARIVEMVRQEVRPSAILTAPAFRNAVRVAVATGCSINCVRHLIATAVEARCETDILAEIEAAGGVPQLIAVRPNGAHRIEEFDAAGGTLAVMQALAGSLETGAMTVDGPLAERLAKAGASAGGGIIATLDTPARTEPGLIVLRGNLAPDGAVVKLAGVPRGVRTFSGPAKVFGSEAEAIRGLETGAVQPGSVIVLRYLGPKGGPGTVFAASFMAALVGAGLGASVAVVTDGELSGLNSGITVGQVMPEAAEGGPLAAVADGDLIHIDLERCALRLDIEDETLRQRLAALPRYEGGYRRGWLALYGELVQPLARGAVLGRRPWPRDEWERA